MLENATRESIEALCNAVVVQAVRDYEQYYRGNERYADAKRFLEDEDRLSLYTKIDGNYLMKRVRDKVDSEMKLKRRAKKLIG